MKLYAAEAMTLQKTHHFTSLPVIAIGRPLNDNCSIVLDSGSQDTFKTIPDLSKVLNAFGFTSRIAPFGVEVLPR